VKGWSGTALDNTSVAIPETRERAVPEPVKLTSLSHGAGCACKIPPNVLHPLLADLPRSDDPALLVGHEHADDAAVYKVSESLAIVTTVDFFTPIVDDPYDFGRIAATNALSDVYAMGGNPLTALNLVAYSVDRLGEGPLREILRGGADVAAEAGVAIVGGHSIDDAEPKYGLAVTGAIDPRRLLRNSTARPGDALYLTKPVGGGIASTAAKRGTASKALTRTAVAVMTTLNRDASVLALAADTSAVTDVTGFGLLGHLHEMALASGVGAEIDAGAVPAIQGVLKLLASAEPPIAGGSRRNREWVEPWVDWDDAVTEQRRWLLCDAMTSGGLLIAARPGTGAPGAPIGRVVEGVAGRISVRA
jgi:selenide,water dikinase